MSGSLPGLQSQVSLLGPGIVGLLVQGIESGLVFAQLSLWFNAHDRRESSLVFIIVMFVTVVGLAQTGIYFASAWFIYVQQFGIFPHPGWEVYMNPLTSLFISVPVQALMIRRCYNTVSKNKNKLITTLLVLLLVASVIMSLWSIVLVFHVLNHLPVPSTPMNGVPILWPYLMSLLLPSLLDLILTGILLYFLIRTEKQVYAARTRKRISHFRNIVWRSALPPTLCTICVSILYILFTAARHQELEFSMTVVQAMTGKLYVLSLLHTLNFRPLQPDEVPTTVISTLTMPAEVNTMHSRGAPEGETLRMVKFHGV